MIIENFYQMFMSLRVTQLPIVLSLLKMLLFGKEKSPYKRTLRKEK